MLNIAKGLNSNTNRRILSTFSSQSSLIYNKPRIIPSSSLSTHFYCSATTSTTATTTSNLDTSSKTTTTKKNNNNNASTFHELNLQLKKMLNPVKRDKPTPIKVPPKDLSKPRPQLPQTKILEGYVLDVEKYLPYLYNVRNVNYFKFAKHTDPEYYLKQAMKLLEKTGPVEKCSYFFQSFASFSPGLRETAILNAISNDISFTPLLAASKALNPDSQKGLYEGLEVAANPNLPKEIRDISYLAILSGFIHLKHIDKSIEVLKKITESGVTQVFENLLEIFKFNQPTLLMWVNYLESDRFNTYVKPFITQDFLLRGLYLNMDALPSNLLKWAELCAKYGLPFDEELYLEIQTVFLASKYSSNLLSFRDTLSHHGYLPTTKINTHLFLGLVNYGEYNTLWNLYHTIDYHKNDIPVDPLVHEAMIRYLLLNANNKDLDPVIIRRNIAKANSILQENPTTDSFNSFMKYYSRLKDVGTVTDIFSKMLAHGTEPNYDTLRIVAISLKQALKENSKLVLSNDKSSNTATQETTSTSTSPTTKSEEHEFDKTLELLIKYLPQQNSSEFHNFLVEFSLNTRVKTLSYLDNLLAEGFEPSETLLNKVIEAFPDVDWFEYAEKNKLDLKSTHFHLLLNQKSSQELRIFYLSWVKKNFPIQLSTFHLFINRFCEFGRMDYVRMILINEIGAIDSESKIRFLTHLLTLYPRIPLSINEIHGFSENIPKNYYPALINVALTNSHFHLGWDLIDLYEKSKLYNPEVLEKVKSDATYLCLTSNNPVTPQIKNRISQLDFNSNMIRHSLLFGLYVSNLLKRDDNQVRALFDEIYPTISKKLTPFEICMVKLSSDNVDYKELYSLTDQLTIENICFIINHLQLGVNNEEISNFTKKLLSMEPTLQQTEGICLKAESYRHVSPEFLRYIENCPVRELTENHRSTLFKNYIAGQKDPLNVKKAINLLATFHDPLTQISALDFLMKIYMGNVEFLINTIISQSLSLPLTVTQTSFETFYSLLSILYPKTVVDLQEIIQLQNSFIISQSILESTFIAFSQVKPFSPRIPYLIGFQKTSRYYVASIANLLRSPINPSTYDYFISKMEEMKNMELEFSNQDYKDILIFISQATPHPIFEQIRDYFYNIISKSPQLSHDAGLWELLAELSTHYLKQVEKSLIVSKIKIPSHILNSLTFSSPFIDNHHALKLIRQYPEFRFKLWQSTASNEVKMEIRKLEFETLYNDSY
eukprot:gene2917-3635_t